jgi:hypothetical protein
MRLFHDSLSLLRLMLFDEAAYHGIRTGCESFEAEIVSKLPVVIAGGVRVISRADASLFAVSV